MGSSGVYVSPLRIAVQWLALRGPFAVDAIASLAHSSLDRARAYASRLASSGVLELDPPPQGHKAGWGAGSHEITAVPGPAFAAWSSSEPRSRPRDAGAASAVEDVLYQLDGQHRAVDASYVQDTCRVQLGYLLELQRRSGRSVHDLARHCCPPLPPHAVRLALAGALPLTREELAALTDAAVSR